MTVPTSLSDVPDVSPYIQYIASSGQTVYPYPFPITQDADLIVVINGSTQIGGYSISGVGNDTGGNVTLTTGSTTNDIITLFRDITIERLTQIGQNSGFASATFNDEYNNIYLIMQQLEASIAQCLQIPNTNSPAPTTILTAANYANKYLGFDASGNPTPVALTSSGSLTQAIIGSLLSPVTSRENSAGVTPTNTVFPEGDASRYNVLGDGSTNDTIAVNNTFKVGYRGVPVFFHPNMVCAVTNLTLSAANLNVPPLISGNGATLIARAGSSGTLLTIENPHSAWPSFQIDKFILDGNNLSTIGLEIHGSQRCTYSNLDIRGINLGAGTGGLGCGLYLHSEASFGIYYNRLERIQCGKDSSAGLSSAGACARYGFYEYGPGPQYRNNGNIFIDCYARECGMQGWYIDYAQNTHNNCAAELCLAHGVYIDNTAGMSWYGGYLEANHGNATLTFSGAFAGGETSGTLAATWNSATSATQYSVTFSNGDVRTVTLTNAATTATWSGALSAAATAAATITTVDMHVTSNAGGVWWQPDRIAIVIDGADNANWQVGGMMFMGRGTNALSHDLNGLLSCKSLKVRSTGIGLSGGTPPSNGVNGVNTSDFVFQVSGSTKVLWDSTNNWMRDVVQRATTAGGVFGSLSAIDGSAALEVKSTTKGLLLPRMTTTQRDAIGTPTAGLMIYNSTTNKINVRVAAAWEAVTSA